MTDGLPGTTPARRIAHWATLLAGLLLAACGSLPPLPFLATDTPVPTETPAPTPSPEATPTPTIALGTRQTVAAGGFSFRPPAGFQSRIQGFQGVISNRDDTILISMAGVTELEEDDEPLDTMLANFVGAAAEDMVNLEAGEPYTLTVGTAGLEARAVDLTGEFFSAPIRGRAALVAPSPSQRVFVFAFAVESPAPGRWQNEALPVVVAVLGSLEFSEPVAPAAAACPVSDDESYGYTTTNPVLVGGGALDGPPRQRAYLDHLLGPNGEALDYARTGSVPTADTILDRYEVVYAGLAEPLVLYLDQYRFDTPAAPAGLTCEGAFPLGTP